MQSFGTHIDAMISAFQNMYSKIEIYINIHINKKHINIHLSSLSNIMHLYVNIILFF